jgi:hypothetical protein
MRLRVGALVLALAAAVAGAGPTYAAGPELRASGDGRSFAVLDIPSGVRLKHEEWALSGTGRYRVALLDRIVSNREDAGFNILMTQSPVVGNWRQMLGPSQNMPMPPGRYRLFLISDRPVSLRLSLPGLRARSIVTDHRSTGVAFVDKAPPADGAPQATSAARRDVLASGRVVFQASRWATPAGGPRIYSNVVHTCLVPAGDGCSDDPTDTGDTGVVTTSSGENAVEYVGYADTFDLPARVSAVTSWRGTDRPSGGTQLVVTFPVA